LPKTGTDVLRELVVAWLLLVLGAAARRICTRGRSS
jgi:hypothetical protein